MLRSRRGVGKLGFLAADGLQRRCRVTFSAAGEAAVQELHCQ